MKIAKAVSLAGLLAMTIVLIYGFVFGNFSVDGAAILANPWGIVSLVDLYVGFALFSVWIAFRENKFIPALIWIILMMTLGFWTGALYTFLALHRSQGNWKSFWFGNRLQDSEKS